MKYLLFNRVKRIYFKEYQGNKPIWTTNILDAAQFDTELATKLKKRLYCQSQYVILIKAK